MATQTKAATAKVADDYLELIKRFPLVPIRDDRHLRNAHPIIDQLSVIGEDKLSEGQLNYLLVLGDLTTSYESSVFDAIARCGW